MTAQVIHEVPWLAYLTVLPFHLAVGAVPCLMVRRFLPRRKNRAWELGPLLLFAVLFGMVTWVADENALLLSPFFALTFLLCYGGPVTPRLVTAAIFYPLLVSISMMIDSASYFWMNFPSGLDTVGQAVKASAWILLFLTLRRVMPEAEPLRLSSRMWLLVGALALAPLFTQLSFTIYNSATMGDLMDIELIYSAVHGYLARMAYTVLPFVLLSSLALLFTMARLARYERLAEEQRLEEMNRTYYEQMERQVEQVRRLRHDMSNHLQTLSALPEPERDRYLRELLDSAALQAPMHWSDQPVVNAVLSAKAEEMRAHHIRGDLSAPLPPALPFADIDLCALLANGLDNAVEACRKLPQPERTVTLRARVDRGLFVLRIENSCPEGLNQSNGDFPTTKPDTRRHGLGLPGIRAVAEKYGGTVEARAQSGRFELLVCMPLK